MTRLVGAPIDGGGYHAQTQTAHGDEFAATLGWRPFPGSLNVELCVPLPGSDLPPAPATVQVRGRAYRLWPCRVDGHEGPAALMTWIRRDVYVEVELLAPSRLRDVVTGHVVIELEDAP